VLVIKATQGEKSKKGKNQIRHTTCLKDSSTEDLKKKKGKKGSNKKSAGK
jgi:hypothetical protein